jgi:hypothetical protein
MPVMPSDRTADRVKSVTTLRAPPRRGCEPALWETPAARKALACVGEQGRRGRACAMPDEAVHAWVMSLVRQTWPDSAARSRVAAALAPEVPFWWLGEAEADLVIANALLARSKQVRHAAPACQIAVPDGVRPDPGPGAYRAWAGRRVSATGSPATIAN